LTPPAGRADDFAWPRREVGREQAKGDTPVASTSPDGGAGAPNAQQKPATKKKPAQSSPNFFGFGNAPRQPTPPRPPGGVPRPPGNVGRSAEGWGNFTHW
jgi:hypothetical protein